MNNTELIEIILRQINQPLWENWYIKEKIGSGAYSAVFKVAAKRMNRTDISALKIEPIVPSDNAVLDENRKIKSIEEKRELVINESTIMYNLRNCPNIVSYEDEDIRELVIDGKLEGYYFLIRMEYLSCLSDLLKSRQFELTEKNVLKLAKDIGKGIKAAHDLNIIHRDLKPGNFFRDAKGIYKLGDFNISKQTSASRTFAGTNGYLAPEVYMAKSSANASYTCQADIYSFGICLYQLMNNLYMPFENNMSLEAAIDKRMSGQTLPAPINASAEFSAIILKACAYNRQNRYKSIDEMLYALENMGKSAAAAVAPHQIYNSPPAPQNRNINIPASHAGAQSTYNGNTTPSNSYNGNFYNPSQYQPVSQYPPQASYQKKSFNPIPIIATLISIVVIGISALTCIKLMDNDKDTDSSTDSIQEEDNSSVMSDSDAPDNPTPETDAALSDDSSMLNSTDSNSTPKNIPISEISLNKNNIKINIYEDIEITSVDCPDVIYMNNLESMFGYSYTTTLYAKNSDVVVTVNEDADEKLVFEIPKGLNVTSKNVDNKYYLTIDASDSVGNDTFYNITFHSDETDTSEKLGVEIVNVGPFRMDVTFLSSNPKVLDFQADNTFSIYSEGTTTISWIYNGEIKYQKTITVKK